MVRLPGRQRRRTEPAQDDPGAELDAVAPEQVASLGERIVALIVAESGWRAIYGGQEEDAESGLSRLIAWALIEADDGDRRVVGLVVDPLDRLSIVAADRARAPRGSLTGYGYKEAWWPTSLNQCAPPHAPADLRRRVLRRTRRACWWRVSVCG